MLEILKTKPSARINRYLLIVGLLIFIPCYSFIIQLFKGMGIDTTEFNTVWLSFDLTTFTNFFQKLKQGGHLPSFIRSFQLNILSMTGFTFTFFSLALMLSRRLSPESRLYKSALIFSVLPIIISLADIFPSLLLLSASGDLFNIAGWIVFTISAAYLFRVLVLYSLILWMLIVGLKLLYQKWLGQKT